MFFYVSKILWLLTEPGNLLLLALLVGVVLLWSPWRRAGRWLLTATALAALVLAVIPVGTMMRTNLENRFPPPAALPAHVDGVVVLGGVIDQFVSAARGRTAVSGAMGRLTEFVRLAERYPEARLVFTGGSGVLGHQNLKEAHFVAPALARLGLDPRRVVFEDQSRNTAENATLTKALIKPGPDEVWILITSAFHMPRAVGCFRKAGWNVIADPVDYTTTPNGPEGWTFHFAGGLSAFTGSLHEWLGLVFYRLTGRTDAMYPGPAVQSGPGRR